MHAVEKRLKRRGKEPGRGWGQEGIIIITIIIIINIII